MFRFATVAPAATVMTAAGSKAGLGAPVGQPLKKRVTYPGLAAETLYDPGGRSSNANAPSEAVVLVVTKVEDVDSKSVTVAADTPPGALLPVMRPVIRPSRGSGKSMLGVVKPPTTVTGLDSHQFTWPLCQSVPNPGFPAWTA